MNPRQMNWRTGALILCLAVSLMLSAGAYIMAQRALPDWIEIQEGPVAHGVDKFYRNVYFKGDIEVAGDLGAAGNTDLAGTLAITGAVTLREAAGTITTTQTLTPAVTYYELDPAAAMTLTLAACTVEGTPLILHNTNITYGVTISSTNCLPASTIVISRNDIYVGLCDGSAWVKMLLQNN